MMRSDPSLKFKLGVRDGRTLDVFVEAAMFFEVVSNQGKSWTPDGEKFFNGAKRYTKKQVEAWLFKG